MDLDSMTREASVDELHRRIITLLKQSEVRKAQIILKALLPADQADLFSDLDTQGQRQLLEGLPLEDIADIIEELEDAEVSEIVRWIPPVTLAAILDEMEPDEAADLLGDLSEERRLETLAAMKTAEGIRPLLRYPDDSAGGLMTSYYAAFPDDTPIGQVFRAIRTQIPRGEEIPYIYAVNEKGLLTGVAPLLSLIRTHPAQPLRAITEPVNVWVDPYDSQEKAARLANRYDLMALPVLDQEGRLLGIITADDAIAAQEEEASEDMYRGAGIIALGGQEAAQSDLLIRGPLWRVWLVRIPFLVITLLGGMLAGAVIGVYEETLASVLVLAMFIPVIMDMGGNAGAQSDQIFIRAHAVGQIDIERFPRYLLKETAVGLGMGLLLGVPAGLITAVWQGIPELGLVVGLAMAATLSLSTLVGYLVPYILIRLGLDPAAGASPFITTIKDISGLIIYFSLANLFLSHLL